MGIERRDIFLPRADGVDVAFDSLPSQAVADEFDVVGVVFKVQDLQLHYHPPCGNRARESYARRGRRQTPIALFETSDNWR